MDIPVLIQPVPGKGFVATAPALGWSAEGPTADAALDGIRRRAAVETAHATVAVVTLQNGTPTPNPWLKWAGTWKDDPLLDEFERAVEEYRKAVDEDPNIL